MRDPERYKGLFIFVFTTVVMTVLASWLAWVRATDRTELLLLYFAGLGFVIWKYWDH